MSNLTEALFLKAQKQPKCSRTKQRQQWAARWMAMDLCPCGNRQTHTHYRKIRKDHPISKNVTLRGRTNSERIFAKCGHQYLQGERSCHMLGPTFYNGDILGIIIRNTFKVRKPLFSGRMPASSSLNCFQPHILTA